MKCLNCGKEKLIYVNDNDTIDSYVCLHCNYKYPKQYFFISHSHLDIEKVRIIRNTIEETFFYEPILFFLKSLSEENEIKDLLKREIDERIWFIYCNSENARKSEYVQYERQYVNELINKGVVKHLINIELDKFNIWDEECINYLKEQISHHIKKTKLFFSFSMDSYQIISSVISKLKNMGYSIFDINSLKAGNKYFVSIVQEIENTSYKDGIFIQVINKNVSQFAQMEYLTAKEKGADILRLIFNDNIEPSVESNNIYISEKNKNDANYIINEIINYINKL